MAWQSHIKQVGSYLEFVLIAKTKYATMFVWAVLALFELHEKEKEERNSG